jgi:opacity protein-like surface antigen
MKKLLSLAILLFAIEAYSQSIEISSYYGYQFGGDFRSYEGDVKFNSSENFGFTLGIKSPYETMVQLEYLLQPTDMVVRFYNSQQGTERIKINMNWYQLVFIKEFGYGKMVPYGGIGFGAVHANPVKNEFDDRWKFSMTGKVGFKYFITKKIGLDFHARMLVPIQFGGFSFYAGSGGSGTSVNLGSSILQGDFGAGLILKLGKE